MANTRSSAKRARLEQKRTERNRRRRSTTRTALRKALTAISQKNIEAAQVAYKDAVSKLTRAASKGVLPKGRVARKISRLTLLVARTLPEALPFGAAAKAAPAKKAKAKTAAKPRAQT